MFSPARFSAVALAALLSSPLAFAAVTVKDGDGKVRVEIDGALFTEYHYTGAPHVYFSPIIGPDGAKMTRAWPMEDVPGEEHDHPHHRSLWFAHGEVNGVDFWTEPASFPTGKAHPTGAIVHDKFLELKGGETEGVIRDALKWVAPDGTVPLTSVQTLRVFQPVGTTKMFDFEMTLTAGDKDVVFGDTKEGTFAMRIAESMRLAQPKKQPGAGHILNDSGVTDDKVWGQHAKWVDMSGPVDGKTVGIAIFDHPTNPRHPPRWHARDYGLFAANPFCEVEMDKAQPKGAGDFKLGVEQSITFRYRIILHEGAADPVKLAEQYSAFSQLERGAPSPQATGDDGASRSSRISSSTK